MRDYTVMREVLSLAYATARPLPFDDFYGAGQRDHVVDELKRLQREGLIDGGFEFDGQMCLSGSVDGLTPIGEEFFRDIENGDVWKIILDTLEKAGVDLSYPLLKEVCEEIVRRYVASFIPNI